MDEFVPGQCWISDSEAELGIGLVKQFGERRVTLLFPAAGEERTYAATNAPLTRVRYGVGDWVNTADGQRLLITSVVERAGRLFYDTVTADGSPVQIMEAELDSFVKFSRAKDRLFAGQIDKNSDFELRVETLRQRGWHQASQAQGLLGPRVQLLPHQMFIAQEVAGRYAPRVLLADEVGLGKTIEAGLIVHKQIVLGRINRVLVLTPDSLALQWLVEMLRRFNLRFSLLDEAACDALMESSEDAVEEDEFIADPESSPAATGENPFETAQLVISPISVLSARADLADLAAASDWDLVVVDEAHHLKWNETGADDDGAGAAYRCVERLSAQVKGLLLLTATPEQFGLRSHFARLRLLDPDRYPDLEQFAREQDALEPVRHLVDLVLTLDFNGDQAMLDGACAQLAEYLGASAVLPLAQADDPDAFALARDQAVEQLLDRHGTGRVLFRNTRDVVGGFPARRLIAHPLDPAADEAGSGLVDTPVELIDQLRPERRLGEGWVSQDARVAWLTEWLQANRDEKALVICAAASTASDLEEYLRSRQGIRSTCFHEGMSLVARDRAAAYFAEVDEGAQVLVCSEIGSEGRNFQFAAHLMLFDLPLNPDLLEQRIGRLDRIGQARDVHIHVPHYRAGAQAALLRWYHEGVDAFERPFPAGQALYDEFGPRLEACLCEQPLPSGGAVVEPASLARLDTLIADTRERAEQLLDALRDGRDRLLELTSCRAEPAEEAVELVLADARPSELSAYLDRVFDHFGLDCERHGLHSIVLKPGTHMTVSSFPGLPEDGLTATYQRREGLEREDMEFLTWEHPLVSGAQDLILSGEYGNTALCSGRIPRVPEGTVLLETYYNLHCAGPRHFQLGRYLPESLLRLLNSRRNTPGLEDMLAGDFGRLLERVPTRIAQQVVRHARDEISGLLEQAELRADAARDALVDVAGQAARTLHGAEIERLKALARINPNIRAEEIEQAQASLEATVSLIDAATMRLEAVRVVVAT